MNESTARAERFAPQAAKPTYLWEVAQKPVAIYLRMEVAARLDREVVDNFRSVSATGSEIGGLLLGNVVSGSPMQVSVEDYELVKCDYSRGPLYRLAQADLDRLERAIQARASGSPLRVVGFFRSHTRKGLALDAEDTAVCEKNFREPHQVVLLIRPFATKASSAGFFIWENGAMRAEASYLEFPFSRAELEKQGLVKEMPPLAERPAAPEKASSPAPAAAPEPPIAAPKAQTRAQIVPIASRREAPAAAPQAQMEPPPAPVAQAPALVQAPPAAPEPATKAAPPRPAVSKPEPKPEAKTYAPKPEAKTAAPKPEVKAPEIKAPAPKPVETKPAESKPVVQKAAPAPVVAAAAPAVALPVEAPAPSKSSAKLVGILSAVAVVCILIVAGWVYPGFMRSKPRPTATSPQDPSIFALRVERTGGAGGELLLTWNRESDVVKNASKSVLHISDGPQQENIEMSMADLRNGSIVYTPQTSDVRFTLEATTAQGKVQSEPVRMLSAPRRDSPMPVESASNASKPNGANTPKPGQPEPTAAVQGPQDQAAVHMPAAPKAFTAEPLAQRLRPARPSELDEAPSLAVGDQSAAISPIAPIAAPTPQAGQTRNTPPAGTAPSRPAGAAEGGQVQAAQPMYRVPPSFPALARQARVTGLVELLATVGADGAVKKVTVKNGHPLLQKAAIDAVMKWRYKPAILNGVPTESEVRVTVNFSEVPR